MRSQVTKRIAWPALPANNGLIPNSSMRAMAFNKHTPKQIDIDTTAVSHDSPEVAKRLERIEVNFARFDELMSQLEARLSDEEKPKHPRKPK